MSEPQKVLRCRWCGRFIVQLDDGKYIHADGFPIDCEVITEPLPGPPTVP